MQSSEKKHKSKVNRIKSFPSNIFFILFVLYLDLLLQDLPSLPRLNPERQRQVRVLWPFPSRQISEQPPAFPNWSNSQAWLRTGDHSSVKTSSVKADTDTVCVRVCECARFVRVPCLVYLEAVVAGGRRAVLRPCPHGSPPGSRCCWSGSPWSRWSWAACWHCPSWWRKGSSRTQSGHRGAQSDKCNIKNGYFILSSQLLDKNVTNNKSSEWMLFRLLYTILNRIRYDVYLILLSKIKLLLKPLQVQIVLTIQFI